MAQLRSSSRLAAKALNTSEAHSPPPAKKPKVSKPKTTKATETKPQNPETPTEESTKEKELEIGDQIPDMTLQDQNGKDVKLRDVGSKSKYLVIFAYPKASTPGCTRQAKGFQTNLKEFKELDTQIFGLSADSSAAQLRFADKQGLEYSLLADTSSKLIRILGAKKYPSGTKRSHWVFENGKLKIKKIQISPEVSIESALKDIKAL